MTTGPATTEVREGDLLWTPGQERAEASNLAAFQRWLEAERGLRFAGYHELWRWSVTDLEAFWQAIWDWFGVSASAPPTRVLGRRAMPGAQWFPGARLNYAERVLRRARPGTDALLHRGETTELAGMPWEELAGQVRTLATWLRGAGVRPGDRVVAYLPNVPQAVVAMLAATAVGAIWASCSPDFGWQGVLDRFRQLEPKVLFAVDGYRHGGREFDRRDELRRVLAGLPSVERVVHLPLLHPSDPAPAGPGALPWEAALAGPPVPAEGFRFEQVAFDHPLWVLFSSGTTGLPKALVHGHGGILLEQLKLQAFHLDLRAGDRLFFYTTTGWMMWNFLASSLLLGVVPVLYDGSPLHPDAGVLWRTAQDARVTLLGASPAYVDRMRAAGVVPGASYDLSALRTVFPAGSPVSPECTAWFYRNVKADLWVATGSGGTDCCTGFVGGVPTLPVRAGEIQGRHLGVAAHAFDERGRSVVDQVGELVITEPMPSMPVRLWGDEDGRRYRETYFADHPGVWRHGDFFRVNQRGGCFVLGRSDATLNRHGVRIGTAEVYRALEAVEEVDDALAVCLDLPDGGSFMPLFVTLAGGRRLDDAVERKVRERLRTAYSPRHVPDRIVQVAAIPLTLTGKKLEVPVRRILLGVPLDQAVSRSAVANPQALDDFLAYARTQGDHVHQPTTRPEGDAHGR
jgi:acetoacetyl-CoA synthetase